jgi:potassium-transporting ATPase KdpC subunit
MLNHLKTATLLFLILTVVTGVAYPLLVTGLSQGILPRQANGSLILNKKGKPLGSELIGQPFSDPKYFWGRPSAISPQPYNGTASSGSNQGPTNPALVDQVKARIQALHEADPGQRAPIPVDLVTASGSGLDPHISPAAAAYQIPRVARLRGVAPATLNRLVAGYTEGKQWGFMGEPRVNVLRLNLALNALRTAKPSNPSGQKQKTR